MKITLAVTAKNEESSIQACLQSVIESVRFAESQLESRYDLVVFLDDCSDGTADIVAGFSQVRMIESSGGLVKAQRGVAKSEPFVIYCDADILVGKETVFEITRAMLNAPNLRVAYPKKEPIPQEQNSRIAKALFTYNKNNGFETKRSYFNGKFFAIRDWFIPTQDDLIEQINELGQHNFYNYQTGIRADDIYLSKSVLGKNGTSAITEVETVSIHYRPPATFDGMYRYYRRMRMELERLPLLCPELEESNRSFPKRTVDWRRLMHSPVSDQLDWLVFQTAFRLCKIRYCLERFYYSYFSKTVCPFWPPVKETKNLSSTDGSQKVSTRSKSGI